MFTVQYEKDRKLLTEDQAQHFHQTVAQFFFLCMRDCPDIHPLVAFLTTIVRSPDEDNRGNLKWGLNHLKVMLYMKLYLRDDSINIIFWWVDTSYGPHWYCKSHTGAVMPMGAGAILSFSIN